MPVSGKILWVVTESDHEVIESVRIEPEPMQPLDYYSEERQKNLRNSQPGFNRSLVVTAFGVILLWVVAYKIPAWLAWMAR